MKTDNLHTFSSYDNTAFPNAVPLHIGLWLKKKKKKKKLKKLKKTAKELPRLQPTVLKTVFNGIFCTASLEETALVE